MREFQEYEERDEIIKLFTLKLDSTKELAEQYNSPTKRNIERITEKEVLLLDTRCKFDSAIDLHPQIRLWKHFDEKYDLAVR